MTYPEPRKARPQVVPIRQVRPSKVRPLLQEALNLSWSPPTFKLGFNTCFILQMLEATTTRMAELKIKIRVKYTRFTE